MSAEVIAALARIETKLDILLEALAEDTDQDDEPELTLDGFLAGQPRQHNTPL